MVGEGPSREEVGLVRFSSQGAEAREETSSAAREGSGEGRGEISQLLQMSATQLCVAVPAE